MPVADDKHPAKFRFEQQPLLLPHRIVAYLFDSCGLTISQQAIDKFWKDAIESKEPFADPESSPGRIPLGLYGDAAQLITKVKKEKLFCLWFSLPLFRPRSVRYSRFLLWCCDEKFLYANKTTNSVLRWIVWSFNTLYDGCYPTSRPGNRPLQPCEEPLAGKQITRDFLKFQVTEFRGDWEYHKFIWSFKSSWKSTHVCFRCPAMCKSDDDGLLYWNMDENSTWSRLEFTTAQYISQRLPERNICN